MDEKYKITFYATLIPMLIEIDNKQKILVNIDFFNQKVYFDEKFQNLSTEDDLLMLEKNILNKLSINNSFQTPKIDQSILEKIREVKTGKYNEYK